MRVQQTRAWILLACPEDSGPLSEVIGRADGLNKAIPTHGELTDGLGWLSAAGLIEMDGKTVRRSARGQDMVDQCAQRAAHAFQTWDNLEQAIALIPVGAFSPAELTEEDVKAAYDEYHRRFQKIYRELSAKDD